MKKFLVLIILLLCLMMCYSRGGASDNDQRKEARDALKEYILTDSNLAGDVYFLQISDWPKSSCPDHYNFEANNFEWQYFKVSYYLNDEDFGGMQHMSAVLTKKTPNSLWVVEEFGMP